jgi:hypothetical protein
MIVSRLDGWFWLDFCNSRKTGHYLKINGRWVKKVPVAVVVSSIEVV